jgi:hypothetical protein
LLQVPLGFEIASSKKNAPGKIPYSSFISFRERDFPGSHPFIGEYDQVVSSFCD